MDRLRIGRSIRAIRVRKDWRQVDLAAAAGVSRSFVSDIERGLIGHGDLDRVDRVCQALGAHLDVRVRWHGEGLDRLLDESHADLVDRVVGLLASRRWKTALEVTFNEFGERGSVDVLGWFEETRSLLVVEVKPVVTDAQGTLMPLDRKARLARKIAAPLGWDPDATSRLLVVWDGTTNRRRIERIRAVFDAALPLRGRDVARWLHLPVGSISGLLLMPDSAESGTRRRATGRERVNRGKRVACGTGRRHRTASGG